MQAMSRCCSCPDMFSGEFRAVGADAVKHELGTGHRMQLLDGVGGVWPRELWATPVSAPAVAA